MYDIIEAIKNKTSYRIRFMHIIMGLLFIMLIVKLYSLQITSGDYYSKEVSGTAIRNVTVSAILWNIFIIIIQNMEPTLLCRN